MCGLSTLATDAARELDVLRHDSDALSMDCAQVRVLKETDKIRLRSLLERENGSRLEAQVRLEILGDLTHETLEWELADKELGALLVLTDLAQRHRTWAVAVRLLDATSRRG